MKEDIFDELSSVEEYIKNLHKTIEQLSKENEELKEQLSKENEELKEQLKNSVSINVINDKIFDLEEGYEAKRKAVREMCYEKTKLLESLIAEVK